MSSVAKLKGVDLVGFFKSGAAIGSEYEWVAAPISESLPETFVRMVLAISDKTFQEL